MFEFSKEQVRDLQVLFKKELGVEVSDNEACQHAKQLVNLLRATYKDDSVFSSNTPP